MEENQKTVEKNIYKVKCRKCGTIESVFHSNAHRVSSKEFEIWINEHSTFPVHAKCNSCFDNDDMISLHDIVCYGTLKNELLSTDTINRTVKTNRMSNRFYNDKC